MSQLQLIIASCSLLYIAAAAWTYGYVSVRHATLDCVFAAAFFPIYLFGIVVLLPLAKFGENFGEARREKQARIDAHQREVRSHLETVEKELEAELKQSCL